MFGPPTPPQEHELFADLATGTAMEQFYQVSDLEDAQETVDIYLDDIPLPAARMLVNGLQHLEYDCLQDGDLVKSMMCHQLLNAVLDSNEGLSEEYHQAKQQHPMSQMFQAAPGGAPGGMGGLGQMAEQFGVDPEEFDLGEMFGEGDISDGNQDTDSWSMTTTDPEEPDPGEVEDLVREILGENPGWVENYRGGVRQDVVNWVADEWPDDGPFVSGTQLSGMIEQIVAEEGDEILSTDETPPEGFAEDVRRALQSYDGDPIEEFQERESEVVMHVQAELHSQHPHVATDVLADTVRDVIESRVEERTAREEAQGQVDPDTGADEADSDAHTPDETPEDDGADGDGLQDGIEDHFEEVNDAVEEETADDEDEYGPSDTDGTDRLYDDSDGEDESDTEDQDDGPSSLDDLID